MNVTAERILTDALTLAEDDRYAIAEALLASIAPDQERVMDDELLALVEKREAELDSGAVVGRTHDEVMATLRRATGCD